MKDEKNLLRDFVIDCLKKENTSSGYMHFKVSEIIPIQNLMETNTQNSKNKLIMDVLGYVEEHYRDGELSELAKILHCDLYRLSKETKKLTGCNYTDLVQKKRLNQAGYLLKNAGMSVMDIGMMVGYENMSYFHRIFKQEYGMSPRSYRIGVQ